MTRCLNCWMLILDSEVNSCPYCKLLLAQTKKRHVTESQSDKAETAIFENVVFNKGDGWKNV